MFYNSSTVKMERKGISICVCVCVYIYIYVGIDAQTLTLEHFFVLWLHLSSVPPSPRILQFIADTECRSQWPSGLRRGSAAARLLRLRVRILPGAWMFVCCECGVCCQVEVSATG